MAAAAPSETVQKFITGQATTLAAANTAFNTALATAQALAQTTGVIITAGISQGVVAAGTDTYVVWAMFQYATPYIPGS